MRLWTRRQSSPDRPDLGEGRGQRIVESMLPPLNIRNRARFRPGLLTSNALRIRQGSHYLIPTSGSYPTVNERTPVEIPFFGRCEGICPLISGWFQIRVNKPTQPIPGRRIETSAQTWRGGLFVYSCLEPAVHRAHPLPTLDIKGKFTGLPYGAAEKEPEPR